MNNMSAPETDLDPVNILKWYIECGVDETISDSPTNWFEIAEKTSLKQQLKQPVNQQSQQIHPPARNASAPSLLATHKENIELATKSAAACNSLDELKQTILSFDGCSLKKTASSTVFSDGNENSDIMLIGEAPGAEEDRVGKPFIGDTGIMLNKMFAAIDMTRETDFYITNVIPWRPPGNRKPTDAECEVCLPFLKRHIELFKPKMIILIGGTSASSLLNVKTGITKLRGKWQEFMVGEQNVPLVAILHPAYLVRQPHFKKQTWHDLLNIKQKISELPHD